VRCTAAADLAEEMADEFEFFGGRDLDDFPFAFAYDFMDEDAYRRAKFRYPDTRAKWEK
jgi:hypothetical protein